LLAGRYALEHIAGHGGMAVVYAGAPPQAGACIAGSDLDAALTAIVDSLFVVNPQRREVDAVALGDELGQIAERLREKRLASKLRHAARR